MAMIFDLHQPGPVVIQMLKDGKIPGLAHVHQPINSADGTRSLWPDGVRDEQGNHMWFEGDMLLVWGQNMTTDILTCLHRAGIGSSFVG